MAVTPEPAVEIEHLSYAHPGGTHRLDDVSLAVMRGEIACLLGPNGAGKTTLLRCLLGLLRSESGSARIGGHELNSLNARRRAQLVAYVPQATATVFPFTTLDMAVMGRTPHLPISATPSRADHEHAFRVLADLGLDHLADQAFASLSGGERGLALVARALVQEAEVLILDEPTAALDLGNSVRVLSVVKSLADSGRTVLMTTHQPDHALHGAHRAVLMADGRIMADGDPRTELTGQVLTEVYQTPVEVATASLAGIAHPVPMFIPSALVRELSAKGSHPQPATSSPHQGEVQ